MTEPKVTIEEVSDPAESARAQVQHAQFQRNSDWLQSHWDDVLPGALGKFIAVAGQEPFVADTSQEAWLLARAAHPEDKGTLLQYVFPQQGPRIYAHRGCLVALQ